MGPWGSEGEVFCAGIDDIMLGVYDGEHNRIAGMLADLCYPLGLCADSSGGKLYCLSEWPYMVVVIDPTTNRARRSIPIAYYPEAMCLNTTDHKMYVASKDHELGALEVLDGVGDSMLASVNVEGTPTLLAYNSSDDILYAADRSSYWIQAVSGKTDSVFDYLQVFEYPVRLAYSDSQHKLYSLGGDSTISVLKPDLSEVICRVRVPEDLSLLTSNPSGTRLYCGNDELTCVYVIDCEQDRLACAVPIVAPPVSFCYDSRNDMLYCASRSGDVSVIDCAKNSLVGTIPVLAQSIYADSATNAVYCLSDPDLTVVDGQTRAVMRTFRAGGWPVGVASTSSWPYVYVADMENSCLSLIHKASGPAEMAVQAAPDAQATVVRGSLDWAGTLAVMYDKCGRRVADVHRGANDVSGLQPGVYFIRQNGVRSGTYARKVVVAR
jgi:DNA-binding beta-propeller fold protein YncE